MEIRVVNVDVVVTDKAGRRVRGLTERDFEVFEGRARREITNFSEIDATVPSDAVVERAASSAAQARPPIARGNTIVFYIDASSIDPRRRHAVFEELRHVAAEIMIPGDRAAVMSWNRRLHVVQSFTESQEAIQRALTEAEKESGASAVQMERSRAYRLILEELERAIQDGDGPGAILTAYHMSRRHADSYAEQMYAHARAVAISLRGTIAAFAAPDDKRAVIFVGDYLPSRAGAEMMQFVEDTFAPYARTYDIKQLEESLDTKPPSTSNWLDGIAAAANAAGVTMYMISAGGLHSMAGLTDPAEHEGPTSIRAETTVTTDTRRTFHETAERTGGLAFTGGDPRLILGQLADDFRSYYSLGFRPTGRIGKAQAITVRVKTPGLVVRSRRSYAVSTIAEEMSDRVIANLYDDSARGELRVRVEGDLPRLEGRNRQTVPVKVFVEGSKVTLIPRDGTLTGELTVYVCAGDPEAGSSKVLRHTQRIAIPPADEMRFRVSHLTFSFDVVVKAGGTNVISAGALDNVSGSWGLARTDVYAAK